MKNEESVYPSLPKREVWKPDSSFFNLYTPLKIDLFGVFLDIRDSVTNSGNLLGFVVGNRDTEFLLKFHDQLNGIKRVSSQVVCETCFGLNLCFFNTKFVYNNSNYFAFNF